MKLLREIVNDIGVEQIEEATKPEPKKEQPKAAEKNDHKQLLHLHHLEDLLIHGGDQGFDRIIDATTKTHDFLSGNSRHGFSIQTKFDGSPGIVWGHHPETGKFFIG